MKSKSAKKSNEFLSYNVKKRQVLGLDDEFGSWKQSNLVKDVESDLESLSDNDLKASKVVKRKKDLKRCVKTNFEKFLEMEAVAFANSPSGSSLSYIYIFKYIKISFLPETFEFSLITLFVR